MRSVLLALVCMGGVAFAQPKKEAAEHFAKGEKAQSDKRWSDAIAEYEQAYAAVPHANALFNIAFCYEQLEDWQRAADFYEHYLQDDPKAVDAPAVTAKIKVMHARVAAAKPNRPETHVNEPPPQPEIVVPPTVVPNVIAPPPEPPAPGSLGHLGATYGLGFGETPVERWLAHGGVRFARHFDLDGILGAFGKNDYAIGAMLKIVIAQIGYTSPYLRASATIGYAKQDSSSSAGTKTPIGFEVGGGALFGKTGAVELQAGLRWVSGGWDAMSTTSPTYVNDAIAFTIDLGFVFDLPNLGAAR